MSKVKLVIRLIDGNIKTNEKMIERCKDKEHLREVRNCLKSENLRLAIIRTLLEDEECCKGA